MGLDIQKTEENIFHLAWDGRSIGTVELYDNAFHQAHQYLRLRLAGSDPAWAELLFSRLQAAVGKPLQVMVSSCDAPQTAFLTAGGFVRRRRCYELEVTAADFCPPQDAVPLEIAVQGQPEYGECCRLLYDQYRKNHAAVNPLTASFSDFCAQLPEQVVYEKTGGQVCQAAFVEENEIAYLASADLEDVLPFAGAVASRLFAQYGTVFFECDDCDPAAMALMGLFRVEVQESYDTYVREGDGT